MSFVVLTGLGVGAVSVLVLNKVLVGAVHCCSVWGGISSSHGHNPFR